MPSFLIWGIKQRLIIHKSRTPQQSLKKKERNKESSSIPVFSKMWRVREREQVNFPQNWDCHKLIYPKGPLSSAFLTLPACPEVKNCHSTYRKQSSYFQPLSKITSAQRLLQKKAVHIQFPQNKRRDRHTGRRDRQSKCDVWRSRWEVVEDCTIS